MTRLRCEAIVVADEMEDVEGKEEEEVKSRVPVRSARATRTGGSSAPPPDRVDVDDGDDEDVQEIDDGGDAAAGDGDQSNDEEWQEAEAAADREEKEGMEMDEDAAKDDEDDVPLTAKAAKTTRRSTRPQRSGRTRSARYQDGEEEEEREEESEVITVESGDSDVEAEAEAEPLAPITDSREITLSMRALNPHLSCGLCKGYYREATVIIECAHTCQQSSSRKADLICKACLMRYIESTSEHDQPQCPRRGCPVKLRTADPLRNEAKFDRALQNLVDKLLPQFLQREHALKRELLEGAGVKRSTSEAPGWKKRTDVHTATMLFELVPHPSSPLPPLPKPVIRANPKATVRNIRQLIVRQAHLSVHDATELLVQCCDELLGSDHSLEFVWRTRWHEQDRHMTLTYKLLQP